MSDALDDGLVQLEAVDIVGTSWRNGTDGDAPQFEAGEVYELTIALGPVGIVFAAGHRIRLQLSSAAFPYYDRNMNTGNPVGTDAKGIVAVQTIHHTDASPSAPLLPVVSGALP